MRRLSIGAFAQESGLSPKALRLYDDLGLLAPADVDPRTGYRSRWRTSGTRGRTCCGVRS